MNVTTAPTFFSGSNFRVASFGGSSVCAWGGDNGYLQIAATTTCANTCYAALSNCFSVNGTITGLTGGSSFGCLRYGPNTQCWGASSSSQTGLANTTLSIGPPGNFIGGLSPQPIDVQAFGAFACALLSDGVPTLKCWGHNFTESATAMPPVTVTAPFPAGVRAAALSTGTSGAACVITTEGSAFCFGDNAYGEVGNGLAGGGNSLVLTPAEVVANW
jgi:hypothetical protein